MWNRLGAALGALTIAACGKSGPDPTLPVHGLHSGEPEWHACPPEWGGAGVECLRAQVPLDHSAPEEPPIVILARRIQTKNSVGQVWLLDGGPGEPAFVQLFQSSGLDVYIPSHRGTFDDSLLSCKEETTSESPGGARITPDEWGTCLATLKEKWGEGLAQMSAKAGAQDVAYLMSLHPTERRLVYGGSYGTLWAQRLFEVEDLTLHGAWLDSVVDLEGSLERVDAHADGAVRNLLSACESIEACAALFVQAPLEAAAEVIAAYDAGEGCGQESWNRNEFQGWIHSLQSGAPQNWPLIAAAFARASRCDAGDEEALSHASLLFAERLSQQDAQPSGVPSGYSPELNRTILYRELYRFDVSDEERDEFERTALAHANNWPTTSSEASQFGSDYRDPDPFVERELDFPIYLLSGALDHLDPPSWAASTQARYASSQLISAPWAGHTVLKYLGTKEGDCGRDLLNQFLRGDEFDSTCASAQPAPSFSGDDPAVSDLAKLWFNDALF